MAPREFCVTCKYAYAPLENRADDDLLRCRRYPPHAIEYEDHEGTTVQTNNWPQVYETEWCGEYSRAQTAVVVK